MEGSTSYLDLLPPELKYQISRIIEGQPFEFQNLPDYLWKHVAVFVRYKDLMGLCETSKKVQREICGDDFFWKAKLKEDFGRRYPTEIPEESGNWRSEYENFRERISKDMYDAVIFKQESNAKEFLDTGAINPKFSYRNVPLLFVASAQNYTDIILGLLELGADPNVKNETSTTPLLLAANEGNTEVVRELLNRGAYPNIQADNGLTALMRAAKLGHSEIVNMLLEVGADPDMQKKIGRTALMEASQVGNLEIVQMLIEAGAGPNFRFESRKRYSPPMGGTPDANIETYFGSDALILASGFGHPRIVLELLKVGADPNVQNSGGYTALIAASKGGYPLIVKILLENGANIDTRSKVGFTALFWASEFGHLEVVRELLNRGVDPDEENDFGETPLDVAQEHGHTEIVNLLRVPSMTALTKRTLRRE